MMVSPRQMRGTNAVYSWLMLQGVVPLDEGCLAAEGKRFIERFRWENRL
jgi:hypothetical protein